MAIKKIIDDLLLVVQNLIIGNTTIFRNRETKEWIEYEIYSTENIPVITMRYSINPSGAKSRDHFKKENEKLIDKNTDLLENILYENINEISCTPDIITQNFQKIFPINQEEEDSGRGSFLIDEIKNNWIEINTRSSCEIKNVSNVAESSERTSKFLIDSEVHSETIPSQGDYTKHEGVTEVICETTLKNKGNRRMIKKFGIVKNRFKCRFCNKVFNCENERKIHEKRHSGETPYTCTQCNKSFNKLSYLSRHLEVHTNEKPFTCNQCGKSFRRSAHLRQHTNYIHCNDRPFPCQLCEKSFKMKSNLNNHIKIHTSEKPYNCKFCDKSFRYNTALTVHTRLHTGEKPNTCVYCGKRFVSASHRSKHEKSSHQGKI